MANTTRLIIFKHGAYYSKSKSTDYLKQRQANSFHFYNNDGAQAYLAIWKNKAILAFRGTQPLEIENDKWPKAGFFQWLKMKFMRGIPFDIRILPFLNNDLIADLKLVPTQLDSHDDVKVHSGFLQELNKVWPEIIKDIEQHVGDKPLWVTGHSLGAAMSTVAEMRYALEDVITFGEPRAGSQIDIAFKAKNISVKEGKPDIRYDHLIVYYSENLS